jgi:hypothetical protein
MNQRNGMRAILGKMPMAAAAFALLLGAAGAAGANCASEDPCYEYIPYYNNDPFTFCTQGVPWHCWAPISPQMGTYTVTNQYCFNPVSAQQYARVCPKGFTVGGGGASIARDPADASP